jgi:hypothetical protein
MMRSLADSFGSKAARTLVASASIFALASGFNAATTTPADAAKSSPVATAMTVANTSSNQLLLQSGRDQASVFQPMTAGGFVLGTALIARAGVTDLGAAWMASDGAKLLSSERERWSKTAPPENPKGSNPRP